LARVADSRRIFFETLFSRHRRGLQAYFQRRLRDKADAPDLAQEVYIRMLRLSDTEAIRNPQVYLYTVASNLLKEHTLLESRRSGRVELDEVDIQRQLGELPGPDGTLQTQETVALLRAALEQLPPRWRTALILQYRYGLTYAEIADRLGVSANMVKKYLAQALGRCRRELGRWELT